MDRETGCPIKFLLIKIYFDISLKLIYTTLLEDFLSAENELMTTPKIKVS